MYTKYVATRVYTYHEHSLYTVQIYEYTIYAYIYTQLTSAAPTPLCQGLIRVRPTRRPKRLLLILTRVYNMHYKVSVCQSRVVCAY